MSLLTASVFLKALGWALVNSIWQFAICWLVYHILISGTKNLIAAARHTMALCLLFLGTFSFIIGFSWKYYTEAAATGLPGKHIFIENSTWYDAWQAAGNFVDALMPYWSLLYLCCVILLFLKLCFFVQRAGNLQNNGITKMNAVWRTYVKNTSAQLGIQKEVKAFLSACVDTPQVIGFLKPVILVPAACLANLSPEQLEAVLLHELVHIKRNDYLVNMFVAGIEIVFFFNPFVKQITAHIRKEREYSCDDMVMQFQYHPRNYAAALLTLEKNRLMPVTYGIAANGKNQQQLLTRIQRIVGIKNKQEDYYRAGACLLFLLLLGFMATIQPEKMTLYNFGAAPFGFDENNFTDLHYNNGSGKHFTNDMLTAAANREENKLTTHSFHRAPVIKNSHPADNFNENLLHAAAAQEDIEATQVLSTAGKEIRDFSLPQKEAMTLPLTEEPPPTEDPYVPVSSFSYQFTQDTSMPKIKGETYSERLLKEALIKAEKAMEQINWQKIEKQLKYKKQDLTKLKKEIRIQLQNLNWQNLDREVQDQVSQEQAEKIQQAFSQDYIKQYRQTEAWQEAMQKQLAEQAQLNKENNLRIQESQKAAVRQQKKLQEEMKKRKIIYI